MGGLRNDEIATMEKLVTTIKRCEPASARGRVMRWFVDFCDDAENVEDMMAGEPPPDPRQTIPGAEAKPKAAE